MSGEKIREREVHKYYQSWLESSVGYDSEASNESNSYHDGQTRIRPSKDKALIAFAQLGCLRLSGKRCAVSLIATTRQYIIAEATKTLSLISNHGSSDQVDELWFGNASIPRSQGISEAALTPAEYTAYSPDGRSHKAPALVINDVTLDERFSTRAYTGNGVSFYAGVPIMTPSGFPIGVYTVIDDKPRGGIHPDELLFLTDMAKIVMEHLETVRNEAARFRGEKMVLGIGRFIQGDFSIVKQNHPLESSPATTREKSMNQQPARSARSELFKGMTITDADPSLLLQTSTSITHASTSICTPQGAVPPTEFNGKLADASEPKQISKNHSGMQSPPSRDEGTTTRSAPISIEEVFSRAANILRETTAADGVLFLDAVSTDLTKRSNTTAYRERTIRFDTDAPETRRDLEHATDFPEDSCMASTGTSTDSAASESGYCVGSKHQQQKVCRALGYSVNISSQSSTNESTIADLSIKEKTLRRLIRRYPRGKMFFFSAEGNLSSSEGDHSKSSGSASGFIDVTMKNQIKGRSTQAIANELMRIVPGARNVVWLPLWDFSKQRWSAGTFLWSRRPERLISAQEDLVYLRSFSNSIMAEISRLDAVLVDKAKSTFVSNISHELRSPLHGILGSVELLRDTKLDGFQSSLVHAVDLCGKTLIDTIDHVLDYSKINNLGVKDKRDLEADTFPVSSNSEVAATKISSVEDDFDLATIVEEVIDVVYAGSTSRTDDYHQVGVTSPDASQTDCADASFSSPAILDVILDLEPMDSWWVRSQSGAIRRILMNIFGNALKYTSKGSVKVTLSANPSRKRPKRSNKINVTIEVEDTGRGMSAEFIRNHAFTPFTQESQFSVGTGLGLSIVQQIVNTLGGKIDLNSEKGVGTTMKVNLALPVVTGPEKLGPANSLITAIREKVKGMTFCIIDPNSIGSIGHKTESKFNSTLENMARNWFGMNVMTASSIMNTSADFYVVTKSSSSFQQLIESTNMHDSSMTTPVIVVTSTAAESAGLIREREARFHSHPSFIEIITQPVGPLRLARTLSRFLEHSQEEAQILLPQTERRHHLYRSVTSSSMDSTFAWNAKGDAFSKYRATSESELGHGKIETSYVPLPEIDCDRSQSPRVLLVDDNEINLRLLKAFMHRAKVGFETASDGYQAVQAFEKGIEKSKAAFSHIFMDINMPVMDGVQATHEIRSLERRKTVGRRVKIIALTGDASEQAQKDVFRAGADLFVPKPLKMKEAVALVKG